MEKQTCVQIQCEKCGCKYSDLYISSGPGGIAKMGICQNCNSITLDEFEKNPNYIEPKNLYGVHCPYCNSMDCKKISSATKARKSILFGVFAAGEVSKTWHCNNCGSNFG